MTNKFDELAKTLAQSVTRRGALRRFGVGLAGFALASIGLPNVARCDKSERTDKSRVMYLEGEIVPDHDDTAFRLYPIPQNRHSYYLIRKADVKEDLQKGIIGSPIRRVPLAYGTEVMTVRVKAEQLGITIADSGCPGTVGCVRCDSCDSGCCTRTAVDGDCWCDACCDATPPPVS